VNCGRGISSGVISGIQLSTFINPLECKRQLQCYVESYELGTLAVDGWAVTYGIVRRGLGGAAARPGPSSLYQM